MWNKLPALAAVGSLIISIIALLVSTSSSNNNARIVAEALQTARQANEIALGRIYEPPVVEIYSRHQKPMSFVDANSLDLDLEYVVSIRNKGKVPVDALGLELIGIQPFTYPVNDPRQSINPLPAYKQTLELDTAISPGGLAHIDLRRPILMYLLKLRKVLNDQSMEYSTDINIVLSPRATGQNTPLAIPLDLKVRDRVQITVVFHSSIVESVQAKRIISEGVIMHRVYSP